VPKQLREHGLAAGQHDQQPALSITEAALRKIIREYTRESGVRNLEREIATLCRKVARQVASRLKAEGSKQKAVSRRQNADGKTPQRPRLRAAERQCDPTTQSPYIIDSDDIPNYLGQRRFHYGTMEEKDEVGAATGLVYTEFGGDIVTIEVSLMRGHDS